MEKMSNFSQVVDIKLLTLQSDIALSGKCIYTVFIQTA